MYIHIFVYIFGGWPLGWVACKTHTTHSDAFALQALHTNVAYKTHAHKQGRRITRDGRNTHISLDDGSGKSLDGNIDDENDDNENDNDAATTTTLICDTGHDLRPATPRASNVSPPRCRFLHNRAPTESRALTGAKMFVCLLLKRLSYFSKGARARQQAAR